MRPFGPRDVADTGKDQQRNRDGKRQNPAQKASRDGMSILPQWLREGAKGWLDLQVLRDG